MMIFLYLSCALLFRETFSTVSTLAPTYFDSDELMERYFSHPTPEERSEHFKNEEKHSHYDSDVTYDKKDYLGDVMKYYNHYPTPPSTTPQSINPPPVIKSKTSAGGFGKIDISIEYGCCASSKQAGTNSTTVAPPQDVLEETARYEKPSLLGLPRFGYDAPLPGYAPVMYPGYQSPPGYMSMLINEDNNNRYYEQSTTQRPSTTKSIPRKTNYDQYREATTQPTTTTKKVEPRKDVLVAQEQFYSVQQPYYGSTMPSVTGAANKGPADKNSYYGSERIVSAIPIYSTHIIQPVAVPIQGSYYFGPNSVSSTESSDRGTYYENHVTPRSILHDVSKIVIEDVPSYNYNNIAKPPTNYRPPKNNIPHVRTKPVQVQTGNKNYKVNITYTPNRNYVQPNTYNNYQQYNYNNERTATKNYQRPTNKYNLKPDNNYNYEIPHNFTNFVRYSPANTTAQNFTTMPQKIPIPQSKFDDVSQANDFTTERQLPPRYNDRKQKPNNQYDYKTNDNDDDRQMIDKNREFFTLIEKQAYDYLVKATLKDFQTILRQKIDKKQLEMLNEERKMLDRDTFDSNDELTLKTLDFLTLYERYADILKDKDLSVHMLHDIDRAKEYLSMKLNKFWLELSSFESKDEFIEKFNYYKEREKPPGLMNILYDWYNTLACNPGQLDPNKIKLDLLNVMKNEKRYWLLLLKN